MRGDHRVAHVGEQRVELGVPKRSTSVERVEQPRVAHAKNVANHGTEPARPASISDLTLSIAVSSTSAMLAIEIACALSPRPAAWLTTTAIAA